MSLRDSLTELETILDGEEMTGKQAAIIISVWMGAVVAFGAVSYLVVFVLMDF
ncbi:hypothetical protein ACFO5R_02325 [Halosolutus amylolyticus]|uniref:Uncharacterized protein n=1 Tax=Halosolutus amylolyticus TaxID=2932267 RepID=A0ABD5PK14_9EURY|nr:hypothetical protein [Halosolutus amylolyticus]